ncbi:MAG: cytochrome-c peroxidase [Planctomycetota bacterium]|jgi:cytochrome c peroxidase
MTQLHHFAPAAFLSLLITGTTELASQSFPIPPTPTNNPTTVDKVLLGKTLFWDEQLSSTRTIACGTCHIPAAGGSDPRSNVLEKDTLEALLACPPPCHLQAPVHPGHDGVFGTADDCIASPGVVGTYSNGTYWLSDWRLHPQVTRRKTPSMINAAFAPELFWDGRAGKEFYDPEDPTVLLLTEHAALENQAAGPPVSTAEMAHMGRGWTEIAERVKGIQPMVLATDIPDGAYEVPSVGTIPGWKTWLGEHSYQNLFTRAFGNSEINPARIIMAIAAYERTLISDDSRFDRAELDGPALTLQEQRGRELFFGEANCVSCHDKPEFTDHSFRHVGVRPQDEDMGRSVVSGNPHDDGAFKVPSLRNVELRVPLLHNGRFGSLEDAVDFYDRGGDFPNEELPVLNLSVEDKAALAAFLRTLTDERVANELPPFDRPTLYTETDRVPQNFGGSSGGGDSLPYIMGLEPPLVGNENWTLAVDGAPGGAHAFLLWGRVADVPGTMALGVRLHLDQSIPLRIIYTGMLAGVGPAEGYGSYPLKIPDNPSLIGEQVFAQWLILHESGPFGLLSSDALAVEFF